MERAPGDSGNWDQFEDFITEYLFKSSIFGSDPVLRSNLKRSDTGKQKPIKYAEGAFLTLVD